MPEAFVIDDSENCDTVLIDPRDVVIIDDVLDCSNKINNDTGNTELFKRQCRYLLVLVKAFTPVSPTMNKLILSKTVCCECSHSKLETTLKNTNVQFISRVGVRYGIKEYVQECPVYKDEYRYQEYKD